MKIDPKDAGLLAVADVFKNFGIPAREVSRGVELITKGLHKMAETEKQEKEKSKNEAEILNAYLGRIITSINASLPRFTLNQPAQLDVTIGGSSIHGTEHFIGEEKFAFRGAEWSVTSNLTFLDLHIVNPISDSITSDYITVSVSDAKKYFEGFIDFYNKAFDYANERMIMETKKEAKEKEEKAHKEALKPVIDDPLFGSW